MVFAEGMWAPDFSDNANKKIFEICEIVVLDAKNINEMYIVCKTYNNLEIDAYKCYCVNRSSLQDGLCIVNIVEYLSQHQYPVKVRRINDVHMFRCKRF